MGRNVVHFVDLKALSTENDLSDCKVPLLKQTKNILETCKIESMRRKVPTSQSFVTGALHFDYILMILLLVNNSHLLCPQKPIAMFDL